MPHEHWHGTVEVSDKPDWGRRPVESSITLDARDKGKPDTYHLRLSEAASPTRPCMGTSFVIQAVRADG